MWLFIAFLAIPLIEIALFIQIGGVIGLGWTLVIVVLTAVLGAAMVRSQGLQVLQQVQRNLNDIQDPTEPLAHGAMILFAGALLLTPGFFTDTIGFSLLLPPVRQTLFQAIRSRITAAHVSTAPRRPHRPDIVEGEFEEVDPIKSPSKDPSGWTKH